MSDPTAGPEALYVRYCCVGQFAAQVGDTLFLHGALHSRGLGFVPGREERCESVANWCHDMDVWHTSQMESFLDSPAVWMESDADSSNGDGIVAKSFSRPFDDLLDYVVPWAEGHKFYGLSSIYSDGEQPPSSSKNRIQPMFLSWFQ